MNNFIENNSLNMSLFQLNTNYILKFETLHTCTFYAENVD